MKLLLNPTQAFRELNVQVKKIAMGDHHTLVLGDDHAVYAMGDNTQYLSNECFILDVNWVLAITVWSGPPSVSARSGSTIAR